MCNTAPGLPFLHVTCRSRDYRCSPLHLTFPVSILPAEVLVYRCEPLHLAFLVCLSPTGVSALQICTPVQFCTIALTLPCLPLTYKSVMITDVHHCTWPSLSPSQRQEGHYYRCASLHLAFSVSLTCRSVRITDVHLYTWPSFFPSHLHEWTPLVNENRAPNIFSV